MTKVFFFFLISAKKNRSNCYSYVLQNFKRYLWRDVYSKRTVFVLLAKVGACGGNYTAESGVIYSPDFPDKYARGRVCYWTIQVKDNCVFQDHQRTQSLQLKFQQTRIRRQFSWPYLFKDRCSRRSLFFQVPGASVILFNFTFFNIMDQADMVELLDGYTNQVVARFDGRNPPREIVNVSADFVILYFYSDRTNEAQGFSMLYQGRSVYLRVLIL